jgi:hypothetical protein
MVSVRRPGGRLQPKSGGSASLFTIRNAIIFFIVAQCLNLTYKSMQLVQQNQNPTPNQNPNGIQQPSQKESWIQQQYEKVLPPPDIKLERIHEAHQQDPADHQSDHLDGDEWHTVPKVVPKVQVVATEAADIAAAVAAAPLVPKPVVVVDADTPHTPDTPQQNVDAATREILTKHGSGPTKAGFVVDFLAERQEPSFRKEMETVEKYAAAGNKNELVAKMVGAKSVKPCEWYNSTDRKFHVDPACRLADSSTMFYNTAPFPRTVCDEVVEPDQAIDLPRLCHRPARLFPEDVPPVSGQGMPPIVIQSQPGMVPHQNPSVLADPAVFRTEETCDIPCKYELSTHHSSSSNGSSSNSNSNKRYIAGTEWKIIQTADDPYFSEVSKMERTAFRYDEYYSTSSLQSSVPLSQYSFEKYNLRDRPAIDWETAANQATYTLDQDCTPKGGGTRRQKWLAAVMAVFPVAAYGSCQHNSNLDPDETIASLPDRIHLAQKNRMALAFEAGTEKDYMTEITWEALLSGAVPVILGAANSMEILPANSAIDAKKFQSWDTLAAYVKEVSENKTLWESYQTWRNDDTELAAFEKRFAFTKTSPECRLCRWAYAKMYGLGWDHEQQVVQETHIPRQLCLEEGNKVVTKPFREVWVQRGTAALVGGGNANAETCTTTTSSTTIETDNYKVVRSVMQHDGVTDIHIIHIETESADEDVVLRLHVDVQNTEGAFFRNTHTLVPTVRSPVVSSATIQDEYSKVTVLANWQTAIHSPDEGIIEIVIHPKGESFDTGPSHRIRVITEDINPLHDKMTEFFPSSFGKLMTKDFIDPVEMYYVD